MTSTLSLSSHLLLLFSFASYVTSYAVGISLGQTYLTSAYYTETNELIPIVRIAANDAWKSYFSQTWDDPRYQESLNDSEVKTLFKTTLQQAKEATETALNHANTIYSITAPDHFSHTPSFNLLTEAAIEDGLIYSNQQVISGLNGAQLAYNLDSCSAFGLKGDENCDMENGPNFIMVVRYESTHLSVNILDAGKHNYVPYNIERYNYTQYGEKSGSILDPSRGKDLSQDLQMYLETFAEDMRNNWYMSSALQYLRAIVLSGEASSSGVDEMRIALGAALPHYQDKMRISLDPHFVGAFGAAQRARQIVQNPKLFTTQDLRYAPGGHGDL